MEWVIDINELHQLESGIVTYAKGGILDLVISSYLVSNQITKCYVELYFYVTSDHETVEIWLELKKPSSKAKVPIG